LSNTCHSGAHILLLERSKAHFSPTNKEDI
jgi:hypothetical protein